MSNTNLPDALDGRPPAPGGTGEGCALASDICRSEHPRLEQAPDGKLVRCFHCAKIATLRNERPSSSLPSNITFDVPKDMIIAL